MTLSSTPDLNVILRHLALASQSDYCSICKALGTCYHLKKHLSPTGLATFQAGMGPVRYVPRVQRVLLYCSIVFLSNLLWLTIMAFPWLLLYSIIRLTIFSVFMWKFSFLFFDF
jgi:hypothetical protein